jgi:uncharacterized protein (DUF427 family)
MGDEKLQQLRNAWKHTGRQRPAFAIEPKPGQESVWDYPRPPVIVPDNRHIVVIAAGMEIARTLGALRVLETASPPTIYISPGDIQFDYLEADQGHSFCEWKGQAFYYSVHVKGQIIHNAAWYYPNPFEEFSAIRDFVAFYPSRVECYVSGELVKAQSGGFYGGWITMEIVGPFKGEPGSSSW